MKLSVIICTHNPRADYLQRVLDALKGQTLPMDQWELLLVDNASPEPLAEAWDLSWHPMGRHIHEPALGTLQARLCGMANARADVLLWVDDDNVLSLDYLEKTVALAEEWPKIGAWSGNVIGEFEEPPAKHLERFLGHLALRTVTEDVWGNTGENIPFGAGMGFRRSVAQSYLKYAANKVRLTLGRGGKSMIAGEDTDIARASFDVGLGTALFAQLRLIHLIPKKRLTEEYLLRLIQGNIAAYVLEDAVRGRKPPATSRVDEIVKLYKHWRGTPWERQVNRAVKAGRRQAIDILKSKGIEW